MTETSIRRERRILWLKRLAARVSGGRHYRLKDVFLRWKSALGGAASSANDAYRREYRVALPDDFGAREAIVKLSVPDMPPGRIYSFGEHVCDETGQTTDTVIACTIGGFAISHDLGMSWKAVTLPGFERFPVLQSKALRNGEILFLASDSDHPKPPPEESNFLIVATGDGKILHSMRIERARWHGPRAIDISGDTLIYAEYTANDSAESENDIPHRPSIVWRSRDFARSWEPVFTRPDIRHFHFLQARPGTKGEWWLTSGDAAEESRIWKSTDDGDTWIDQTEGFGATLEIGDIRYERRIFRLTDLDWDGEDIVWGCDDLLNRARDIGTGKTTKRPGSRMFRGNPSSGRVPRVLGICGPEVRNIVRVGDFYVILTQSARDMAPRALLMQKYLPSREPKLTLLFDIERQTSGRTGFTYSRASRSARDGVFFSFRSPGDVFKGGNRILKWQVAFS